MALALLAGMTDWAAAVSASFIPDDCGKNPCTCFIQILDQGGFVKGIINLLKDQEYLDKKIKTAQFTRQVMDAAIVFQEDHLLPPTGTMDDTTLTILIWGITPEELDEVMPIVPGSPETYPDMCYVPSDGGKKRHSNPLCSDMYDPRKVSIRNAAALGYDACSKCARNTESFLHPAKGDEE